VAGIEGFFMEARLTEMRVEISFKKAPTAYTKRCPYLLNTFPT